MARVTLDRPFQRSWTALLLCCLVLVTSCGGDGEGADVAQDPRDDPASEPDEAAETEADMDEPEATESAGAELTPFTIQLDWLPTPSYAPAFLADERGYYEEEGLDVEIIPGGGGVQPVPQLSAGRADMVIGTLDLVPQGIAEGHELVALAVLERFTTAAVMTPESSGIETAQDLEGKSIASCAVDVSAVLLEPYLEAAGVDATQVEMNNVDCTAKVPLLVAGETDAITGFARNEQTRLEIGHGIPTTVFLYVDEGLRSLSTGIFTTLEMTEDNPDLLRRAIRATLRGYADAIEDPEASARAAAELYPDNYADIEVDIAHATLFADFVREQVVERLGYMRDEDWADTIELLEDYRGMESSLEPSEYYTNEFLPEDDPLVD
jgi:NitT/TauT family transport system substrate-binding protein